MIEELECLYVGIPIYKDDTPTEFRWRLRDLDICHLKEWYEIPYDYEKKELTKRNKEQRRAGVYCLVNCDNEIVYIGQSVDMLKRVKQHRNGKQWEYAIGYDMTNENFAIISGFECFLIKKYQPKYNIVSK